MAKRFIHTFLLQCSKRWYTYLLNIKNMGLTDDERRALITLKIERASETILEVPYLIDQGFFRTAANRLYYSCFYMVSALLLQKSFATRTHQGVISLFALHFVKTGIVSTDNGHLYRSLFELRQTGDYDDIKEIFKDDVFSRFEPAKHFIQTIENLINSDN
jgi:uncharacterized protein (UPF0332 family)